MIHKSLRIISYIVFFTALLSIYSFFLIYISEGGNRLGVFTQPLLQFSKFPQTVNNVLKEIKQPKRLLKVDKKFRPVNKLDYDVYALNGSYHKSKWGISLINLRNDSVIHEWYLKESDYNNTGRVFSYSEPIGPILLEDKSIVMTCDESYNLYRLDKESNIVWHNTDFQYNHAINQAEDGNVWACARKEIYTWEVNDKAVKYWDNSLIKVDVKTGAAIFNKSVSELLIENGYSYLIYGIGNDLSFTGFEPDPLHLNDIEPVLNNGPYWEKGDLFLSFRHRSLVILYRPKTNEILRIIQGPFLNQHDVDIRSETEISFFNNNITTLKRKDATGVEVNKFPDGTSYSEIVIYDFEDSTFTSHLAHQFQTEGLQTRSQGLHHIISNGDVFVEIQNKGIIYIFNEESILLKKYYNKPINNLVERSHWPRIYENINF